MPRFDGTGPAGQGPATGRRTGKCSTSGNKAKANTSESGSGMGQRRGRNWGFRFKFRSGNE